MKIRQVWWRRYHLPFVSSFTTAHGSVTYREGLILKLQTDDGLIGLGEIAPLAEFGGGDVADSAQLLGQFAPKLLDLTVDQSLDCLDKRLPARPNTSAIRCGIETAVLDLKAQRRGIRLAESLAPHVRGSVEVNATVGDADDARVAVAAAEAVSHGFRTVKLKVGLASSTAAEVARVAVVRQAIGPNVRLRLDANGAWTTRQAVQMTSALAERDIEFIEQPVPANDLSGMATVRRSVSIPIAADEAVFDSQSARRVVDAEAADLLVVKPMVCGGLREARSIIEMAQDAGLSAIVTSSLESGIGVAATSHLAATLPAGSRACGLATLSLLADDLIVKPFALVDGCMFLPEGSGLGAVLDEERFREYRVEDEQYGD